MSEIQPAAPRHIRAFNTARTTLTPPLFAWVRSSLRLGVAGALYYFGAEQFAHVMVVMAAFSLIATVEIQVAKNLAREIDLSAIRKLIPKRKKRRILGPSYPLEEAIEALSEQPLNARVEETARARNGSPEQQKAYHVALRTRRQHFRAKLAKGKLVAFGAPAGDEDHVEITQNELSKMSLRFTEGRLVSPDGVLQFDAVQIREDLSYERNAAADEND